MVVNYILSLSIRLALTLTHTRTSELITKAYPMTKSKTRWIEHASTDLHFQSLQAIPLIQIPLAPLSLTYPPKSIVFHSQVTFNDGPLP